LVALAYFLAFRLRFEGAVPARYENLFEVTIPWVVLGTLVMLGAFGLYQRLWTFVGQRDYEAVVKGVVLATLVIIAGDHAPAPGPDAAPVRLSPQHLPGRVQCGDAPGQRDRTLPVDDARAARRRSLPGPLRGRGENP